jgi:hypothetical protein
VKVAIAQAPALRATVGPRGPVWGPAALFWSSPVGTEVRASPESAIGANLAAPTTKLDGEVRCCTPQKSPPIANDREEPNAKPSDKKRGAEHIHCARVADFPLIMQNVAFDNKKSES